MQTTTSINVKPWFLLLVTSLRDAEGAAWESWKLLKGDTEIVAFISSTGRRAGGILLLVAGSFKINAMVIEVDLFERVLGLTLGVFEIILGAALVSGVFLFVTRLLAIPVFGLFVTVNMQSVVSGSSDCGCFGRFSFPPFYLLISDSIILVGLCLEQPRRCLLSTKRAITFSCLASIALAGAVLEPRRSGVVGVSACSLLRHDAHCPFHSGEWLVVIHSESCTACRESVLSTYADRILRSRAPPNLAVLRAGQSQPNVASNGVFFATYASSAFQQLPLYLAVDDGVVQSKLSEAEFLSRL